MEYPDIRPSSTEKYQFLAGGGEMGALTRAKDWSKNPVGPVKVWPQSLRTTLGILLNSKFPMFLWWGPELICFYNDAYRPSLGQNGKHPIILGQRAEEAWPEIWEVIKPLIERVLGGGEATWSEDQLIPIYRNGKIEDVYWTFSYSPVNDESGKVAGVLVTCSETTEKVNTLKSLEESNRRYFNNIMQAPVAMCIFKGGNHVVEIANSMMLELWGKTQEQVMNKPIFEGLPEAKGQGLEQLIDNVYRTGEKFVANERLVKLPRNGKIENTYVNFVWEALKAADGMITGIIAIASEVTVQVLARKKVEESEKEFHQLADSLPALVWTTDSRGMQTFASKKWKEFTGLDPDDADTFRKMVHPEDIERIIQIWTDCLASGEIYRSEVRLKNLNGEYCWFYVNGEPVKNEKDEIERWIGTFTNINEQKKTEEYLKTAFHKVEESDKRFRDTVKQAPFGITILHGPLFIVEMANDAYLQVVDRREAEFVGRPLFESLPEVEDTVRPLLDNVVHTGIPFHGVEYPIPVNRYGKQELSYFDFLYHPLKEDDGKISGIIVTVTDVSASVKAKHSLAESEKQFRSLVMQSPIPMTILRSRDFIIEMANTTMFEKIWRKKETDILGRKILDVFPELNTQKYPGLLNKVYNTGHAHREIESIAYVKVDDELQKFYFDFEYAPLFETNSAVSGIVVTLSDVTEKVEARKKVEDAEERLRLAAEATELSTWDLDLQTREIIYSSRLAEIFGHDKLKKLSHPEMRNQIHPEDIHTVVEKAFDLAMQTGLYKYEARIVKPDSGICWIRTQGKVFYDEEKKPVKLIGTLRDITEEKYHEQELMESEQKFRLLADSMPQFIWTGDAKGNLNYFNKSVFDYSGLTPEQINTQGWIQIVHPDDREENVKSWLDSVNTGRDFIFEHRFRRNDGEYRWQLSRAIPQKDPDGNIQMWVGTSTDIQKIKEQDQQKDYFISMASHELKTPITSMKGYVQILQSMYLDSDDAFLKKSLNIIDKQIVTLTNLISDLLDLSKIKSGSSLINKGHFHINMLIEKIIDEMKHINPNYSIIFSKGPDTLIYADMERIGQVIINFLTNAIKYSPGSSEVKIESVAEDGNIIISVKDSGIGINKQDQEKIFERFYRVEGKSEKTFPGFGIGLFIASEIIHKHNGIIGVKSEPGKGSTFYFSLPFTGQD